MTHYNVDAPACESVFVKTEGEKAEAAATHSSISTDIIDTLGALCLGEASILASALNAVYNRVLSPGMTGAELQVTNATAGGAGSRCSHPGRRLRDGGPDRTGSPCSR